MASVSVGIVTYKSAPHLARCLDSLAAQTLAPREVVCVDNASGDGSADLFSARCLDGRLIRNDRNVGYARGQNQAIRAASADLHLALNPDVVLDSRFLERIVAALESDAAAGWACGKVLFMEADGAPTDRLYSTGHLISKLRVCANRGHGERDLGQYDRPERVFGANGAACLYRRRMLEEIAFRGEFLDESFFMYWDDVDLDWRANLAGWRCLYVPDARAWHVSKASSEGWPRRLVVEWRRNRILAILKNDDLARLAARWLAHLPGSALRSAVEVAFSPAIWGEVFVRTVAALGPTLAKRRAVRRSRRISRKEFDALVF